MRLGVSFYYVGNIKEAADAYSEFLETSPAYSDKDWVRFHLDGGDLALHLDATFTKTEADASVRYGAIVSFTVPDVRLALERAKRVGFRQVGQVDVQPYGKQAQLRDPWGNRISLLEPSAAA